MCGCLAEGVGTCVEVYLQLVEQGVEGQHEALKQRNVVQKSIDLWVIDTVGRAKGEVAEVESWFLGEVAAQIAVLADALAVLAGALAAHRRLAEADCCRSRTCFEVQSIGKSVMLLEDGGVLTEVEFDGG